MHEITTETTFDAAHALRNYEGPCENLHGHTFRVQLSIKGEKLNDIGFLADFKILKKILEDAAGEYDHKYLNDLEPFTKINPSSENIAKVFYGKIKQKLPQISKIVVWESQNSSAGYWE